ncbi:tRNA dihydrouridine synthase DusB [Propionispira raffinosivorans]|uniref:tRNA dihydrouridine synthase DusB n=1 Tax=Propionispira raffinosivorans TaxID=86959 RepID=UPI0003828BB5|nr:tRNA dihydrouridine synthase DusB [Propionispira raffinosivorans]
MKIGNIEIKNPLILAPMAGVTDMAYRILATELGCGLVYSEMVSDQGINYRNPHTLEMLKTNSGEHPLTLQLFSADPKRLAEAAKYVESLGCADIIDINMGCPAPKIVKNKEGSALMCDPKLAFSIMKAVRQAVKIPVTVKMRKGWDAEHVNVVSMAKLAEEAGMDAIAVHGRTREEFYRGAADWNIIAEVKQAVKIPVIGNGDVRTGQDAKKIFAQTQCDAVMIGRAAQGNPWIFRKINHFLQTGQELPDPTMQERMNLILRHLDMLIENKGEYIGPREMRKHATWYTKGLPHSAELRNLFNQAENREEFTVILKKLLLFNESVEKIDKEKKTTYNI